MAQATAAAAAVQAAVNRAPAASQGAQSTPASTDYHSLATAMSRLNDDTAINIEKGTLPQWDFKTETFVDWQHMVAILADSHDIRHLLQHPPVADPVQLHKHQVAKRIILLTLPNQDRAYVRGSLTLNEKWGKPDPAKVETSVGWLLPPSVHEVRRLLVLANYFRKFIRGCAAMTAPLTDLLKGLSKQERVGVHSRFRRQDPDEVFASAHAFAARRTVECDTTITALRQALAGAPVLALPDHAKNFTLATLASPRQLLVLFCCRTATRSHASLESSRARN